MSHQVPIFESGLFGKANRFVTNAWTESASAVAANAEGLEWAQRQVVQEAVQTTYLAKITTATVLGTNRWRYDGVAFDITAAGAATVSTGTFGQFTGALNIRELRNTAGVIDGSPLPTGASIGPVGSSWTGTVWSTTSLEGYVWITVAYDTGGNVLYWFDTPNPSRCGT